MEIHTKKSIHAAQVISQITSGPIDPSALFLTEGLTFGELYCLAEGIRAHICRRNLDHKTICLCTLNRAYVAAAMIAALQTESTLILPFALSYQTLEDARTLTDFSAALITDPMPLPAGVASIPLSDIPRNQTWRNVSHSVSPDSSWLRLFTGGSTGAPQIWTKSPKNILGEAAYLAAAFNITHTNTILSTVPPNHIYGLLYAVALPLVSGARVSVHSPSFPKEIDAALADTKATVLISTPTHYRVMKEKPVERHHLRMAFSSAGPLAEEDGIAFARATGIEITEIYGSTETGGIASRKRSENNAYLKSFSCVETRVEEETLWVRSDFLSAELPISNEGFFRTADRAVLHDTYGFSIMGRIDGVVKVGGNRVDLSVIQERLKGVSGVKDAYVLTLPSESGRDNEIVAIVEGPVDSRQVRESIQKVLPSFMLPRRIQLVAKIPTSDSGKYNRMEIEKLITTPK